MSERKRVLERSYKSPTAITIECMRGTVAALLLPNEMMCPKDIKAARRDLTDSTTVLLKRGDMEETGTILKKLIDSTNYKQQREGLVILHFFSEQMPQEDWRNFQQNLDLPLQG